MTQIKIQNLTKTYGSGKKQKTALNNINLSISQSEKVAIIGRSGSGKSTLLNLIGALDKPSSGLITINGTDTSRLNDSQLSLLRGQTIGFIFQRFNLQPGLSVIENITLPLMFKATSSKHRERKALEIMEWLDILDLKEQKTHELSGGQMQRVAIARSLITEPSIILADEPTGNLDDENAINVINILRKINQEKGTTLIVVTHDKEVAATMDRSIRIDAGQVVEDR